MNGTDDAKRNEAIFVQFVMGLTQSGMMQLGKMINPMTQKIEKDMQGARATIGLLVMLREKTHGNLGKTEEDVLAGGISSLQLNYVDELESEKQKAGQDVEEKPASEGKEEAKDVDKGDEAGQSREDAGGNESGNGSADESVADERDSS